MMQCYPTPSPSPSRHRRRGSLPSSTPYDRDGFAARASPMRPIALNAGGNGGPPMSMPGPFRARRNSTSTSHALLRPSSPSSPRKRTTTLKLASTSSASGSPQDSVTSAQTQAQASPVAAEQRQVRLPIRLPEPLITIVSDPWRNFQDHLLGHGMIKEAKELGTTTPDYVLSQLPPVLHDETVDLQDTLRPLLELGGEIPEYIKVPTSDVRSVTHLLAITNTNTAATSVPEHRKRGMLLPIHGLLYASSLVSLPCLGPGAVHDKQVTSLPVVRVLVPSPRCFGTLHRYLYTRSPAVLLSELLPLRYLSRTWKAVKPNAHAAMDVLSQLPSVTLFTHARLIHETWGNAVAVGVPDRRFWAILDRAWDLIIGAIAMHRAKRLEVELAERTGNVSISP